MASTQLSGPLLAPYRERTVNASFFGAVERFGPRLALASVASSERFTYDDVEARVAEVASLLEARGIEAGDRVAILSENRPEWAIADYAVLSIGAVTVPIYPDLPEGQVGAILKDSGARLLLASGLAQAAKAVGTGVNVIFIGELLGMARAHAGRSASALAVWRERAHGVAPDDLATLIYTSGTTGIPKGVMLTHGNLAYMVAATRQHGSLPVAPGEVALSILPLSHVFERAADYYFFAHGVTITHAEAMQTVPRDMQLVRPHHMIAVPRLFEKVFDAVAGAPGVKGRIARWAATTASRYMAVVTQEAGARRRRPSWRLRAARLAADRLVYRVLRERMGGRMKTFICGGAPLDPRVGALFHAGGIPVYEGYGLTETSPVIAANQPGALRLGSAGVAYPGVEVRLGDEGEILVRGPGVTRGYWNQPEATAAAFTPEGWFRTGDAGAIDRGFLLVVDRLKDLIVTAGGKNIAPQPLELRITASPAIAQAVVLGDRRPFPVVLVVPERANVPEPPSAAALAREVAAQLRDAARVERPKRLAVVAGEFTVENGLLTPTLKVRRRAVEATHASLLDALYGGRAGVDIPWNEEIHD